MFIETRPLDDPRLMRFVPGEPVLPPGTREVDEERAASSSPLARRLLSVDGVEGVALGLDDITVRRSDGAEWYVIKPPVLGAIMTHYGSGEPALADPEILETLAFLDARIRPAAEAYGGALRFCGLESGLLTLELTGGGGARKEMMANIILHHLPHVRDVAWQGDAPPVAMPGELLEAGAAALEGPEADAVLRFLDDRVNPAVAAHGGHISLLGVVDHVAYVRMEGGCQGCSASALTLQQGVREAVLAEVASVRDVVDVTDHAEGLNPFYR